MNHTLTDKLHLGSDPYTPWRTRSESDEYTKEQLHEAFTLEHNTRKLLNKSLNTAEQNYAKERSLTKTQQEEIDKLNIFMTQLTEDYLRLHIEKYVGIVDGPNEPQASLDYYFNHPEHKTFYTSNGGYICVVQENGYLFIEFMWSPPEFRRQELTEMKQLISDIYEYGKSINNPVRFTGTKNVIRNHSVELEPFFWQLRLDDTFDDVALEYQKWYKNKKD